MKWLICDFNSGWGSIFNVEIWPHTWRFYFLIVIQNLDWRNGLHLILTGEERWKRWNLTQHITNYFTNHNLKVKNCLMSSLLFHQEVGCGGKCDPYIMIYSLRFNCYDLFPFLLRLSKWLTFYFYRGAVWVRGSIIWPHI